MDRPHVLFGKTLTGVKIAKDRGALLFALSDGIEIVARADGDCCSHSWVEHVEMPALGFPAIVTAVDDQGEVKKDQDDEHDCLRFYVTKITTDRGDLVIDYRNSSNGYYGGNLSWPQDAYFYGGVHGQNVSKCDWQEVAQ